MPGRGESFRRPEEEQREEAPRVQLGQIRPVRQEVRQEVSEGLARQQETAQKLMTEVFREFDSQIASGGDVALQRAWNGSSLKTLLG